MNQLAITIRRIEEGGQNVNSLELSTIEQNALQSIGDLIRLSHQDLASVLLNQVDPTEWILPPVQPLGAR